MEPTFYVVVYDSRDYANTAKKTGGPLSIKHGITAYYTLSKRFARCKLKLPTQSANMLTNWGSVPWWKLWLYPLFKKEIQSLSGFINKNCSVVSPPLWWMTKASTICAKNAGGQHEIPTHVMMVVRNKKEQEKFRQIKAAFKKMGIVNVCTLDRTVPVATSLPIGMQVHKLLDRPLPSGGSD